MTVSISPCGIQHSGFVKWAFADGRAVQYTAFEDVIFFSVNIFLKAYQNSLKIQFIVLQDFSLYFDQVF